MKNGGSKCPDGAGRDVEACSMTPTGRRANAKSAVDAGFVAMPPILPAGLMGFDA